MSSLVVTITETLRYRGAIGQWSWVLHRVTGLGVVLFFVLHVIDTSWAVFYPSLYEKAIAIYQSPLFTVGEFALVFAVVYHAFNGLRIVIMDYKPNWWRYQERAAWIVLGLTVLTLIPTFVIMFNHVLVHYEEAPQTLPLLEVLGEQVRFIVGMAVAVVAAVLFSAVTGIFTREKPSTLPARGSKMERFWWSYMRVSGLLIVPLVFGHLAMVHIIQGVFDITAAGKVVVGTDLVNQSGTAVEFVAHRWQFLVASVAVWKLYDFGLLALAGIHGFNGLRYVLTDYTMSNPILRRASIYLCVIAAVTLLILGGAALLGTIDSAAIDMAIEAQSKLFE
ncbi:MAG: hypothetical protein OHK0046_08800 [Anaerolineae bacterium]